MKKPSIQRQYMVVLVSVLLTVIFASLAAINLFLEPYYVKQKEKNLILAQQQMAAYLSESDAGIDEEEKLFLLQMKENYGIDTIFWDSSQEVLYSSANQDGNSPSRDFMEYILGQKKSDEMVEEGEGYEITLSKDRMSDSEYLEMFASYPDGSFSIMRTPLVAIHQAIILVNRFLIYSVIVIGILGLIAAYFITRNLTAPIKRLAGAAEAMADLDFSVHSQEERYEEFEVLGNSMNHLATQLEKTIIELKSANLELKKDIEQKEKNEEMRREFIANVSHELKTPIALIQGYAEGLKEGIADDPESMEFYLDVINDEAGKMNQMVRKLLTLNQIESSTSQVNLEHFDVVEMLKGVLNSYQIMISQKQAKVSLYAPESCMVLADEYMAEEVIRNYVGNALNHLSGELRIDIRIEKLGEKVHISVFNTGEAIPEESLSRLWEKFYKVDKARTREYGGSGIGLSIVKAVMETLGNGYGVRNIENGVEFWCEFDC